LFYWQGEALSPTIDLPQHRTNSSAITERPRCSVG